MKKLLIILILLPLASFSQNEQLVFGCPTPAPREFPDSATYEPISNDFIKIEMIEDDEFEEYEIVLTVPSKIIDCCGSWAEFCGGEVSMKNFIKDNLTYPRDAAKNGEQGTVYVEFTIKKDGSLTDVKIKKGVSGSLNNEAMRLIKSMPNWIAAEKSGKVYESSFVLPILFKLK